MCDINKMVMQIIEVEDFNRKGKRLERESIPGKSTPSSGDIS